MESVEDRIASNAYLLNKVNIMESTVLKLGPTTWESEVFSRNFHPILMPLKLCKLGVGNIVVPYLQGNSLSVGSKQQKKGINDLEGKV